MAKPTCLIVSSDYLDLDVYLNIRAFYAAAGYRLLRTPGATSPADLLVVLRGDNGSDHQDFPGEIHIYDYVKEYVVDWSTRYPLASLLRLITLSTSVSAPASASTLTAKATPSQSQPADPSRLVGVDAYLPVLPALWCVPWRRKRPRPLHLSNFKRMKGDRYQQQLLSLIQTGAVQVYGSNWQLVDVQTHPLSYWQANRLLARSGRCFGLMWPYQRGTTLSGRMWQAPLQGCFVLSERGTDILGCPGVVELESFEATYLSRPLAPDACRQLSHEAAAFWEAHTRTLAAALGLDPGLPLDGPEVRRQRRLLLLAHLQFRINRLGTWWGGLLTPPLWGLRRRLARLARRLGYKPLPRG
jgi:hypothetical protein